MKKPVMLAVIIAELLSGCVADSGWKVRLTNKRRRYETSKRLVLGTLKLVSSNSSLSKLHHNRNVH